VVLLLEGYVDDGVLIVRGSSVAIALQRGAFGYLHQLK
jgi:hypothetical protein